MSANWNTAWGQWIIEELVRLGTPVFCVAPGSRSTPLTSAVAAHPGASCQVFTDERSAAFFALGVGRATGRPAVIITTSGTAAAHAYPAIIEANQSGVPLLLLSANRPPELHDTGANQTIDQHHLFGDRIRWHRALPCPSPEFPATALLSIVNQAWRHTVSDHPGPVHLDLPFREPLGPARPAPLPEDPRLGAWQRTRTPWNRSAPARHRPATEDTEDLARLLDTTHRGVLLVGTLDDPRERAAARKLANRLGWPTLADITSGLRLDEGLTHALECTDALFGSPRIRSLARPQLVLQLGGPLVSRRIFQAWTESPPDTWITVGPEARR
ncbi:MAG: 2-succinyl-5-enolpyruvyl-6-hydroxy-3-cyclohexene-1-carboxylic-acid synthase, partial [Myxococcota bacterium]|nr:2-succinyl-5-enolpyruvyl-6-hydroxy-3-cyclohexene-1-carboxylic-acid synthase [Myxococcota bacterium]